MTSCCDYSGSREAKIGIILRKLRVLNNYTQREIADKIYVSRPCYSSWENGYHEIPFTKLLLITELYKVDIIDVINELRGQYAVIKTKQVDLGQQMSNLTRDITQLKMMLSELLEKQNNSNSL